MAEDKNIQISLRLSPDLYKKLKNKTSETGRSLNAEVIQAIIEHCDPNNLVDQVTEQIDILNQRVDAMEAFFTARSKTGTTPESE